jgi:hypothetical protein
MAKRDVNDLVQSAKNPGMKMRTEQELRAIQILAAKKQK